MNALMAAVRRMLFWSGLLMGLGLLLTGVWAAWVLTSLQTEYQQKPYLAASQASRVQVMVVEKGRSAQSIAKEFEAKGYFPSWRLLSWYWQFKGEAAELKAGEYALLPDESLEALVARMRAGEAVLYPVKIGEGLNFTKLRPQLLQQTELTDLSLLDDRAVLAQKLGVAPVDLDGRFFPETYHLPRGASVLDLFKQAMALQKKVLAEERAKASPVSAGLSDSEILSLAVLVELETPLDVEKPVVSGVFHERLKRGMKMQSDPTVIYAMGEAYQGKIRTKDLRREHWANTYVIKGLPPVPIAYASRASIRAAFQPEMTGYVYFVANNAGGHYFSKTLAEHNRAVQKYIIQGLKD